MNTIKSFENYAEKLNKKYPFYDPFNRGRRSSRQEIYFIQHKRRMTEYIFKVLFTQFPFSQNRNKLEQLVRIAIARNKWGEMDWDYKIPFNAKDRQGFGSVNKEAKLLLRKLVDISNKWEKDNQEAVRKLQLDEVQHTLYHAFVAAQRLLLQLC